MATLSVLIGGVLGVSRVALAMSKEHELPSWRSQVHPRFKTPHVAIIVLGSMSALLAFMFDLRPLLEVTNVFLLIYHAITNLAALQLHDRQRTLWSGYSWFGLGGCLALLASLPWAAVGVAAAALAGLSGLRQAVR
jgi:basic amino acid/polyamine antiporter, APA family